MPEPPDFPFHSMDCYNYCGPACLLMALESRKVPLTGLTQSALMGGVELKSVLKNDDFASPPEAMLEMLNLKLGSATAPAVRYEIFPAGLDPLTDNGTPVQTAASCLQEIRECFKHSDAPVFALSNGGGHWILIYHWDDGGATRRSDDKYFVRWPDGGDSCDKNSHPYDLHEPAVQHDTGPAGNGDCSKCSAEPSYFESLESHASIKEFLPVNGQASPPGYTGHRILLVPRRIVVHHAAMIAGPGDPQPPQCVREDQPEAVEGRSPEIPEEQDGKDEDDEEELRRGGPVSESEAVAIVQARLRSYIRYFRKHGKLLEEAQARGAVRVNYLTDRTKDYYLVPVFAGQNKAPHFMARVSAADGGIRSMASIRGELPGKVRWLYQVPADQKVFGEGWTSDGDQLVWKHCAQTLSPFRPLLAVRKGEAHGFYDVFSDKVHAELTPANVRSKYPHPRDPNPPPPDPGQHAR